MHFLFIVLFTGGVSNGRVFWTKVRGDRRGKGFGAEQLLGLALNELIGLEDGQNQEHSKQQLVSTLQQ
jgi:hypothetical protein